MARKISDKLKLAGAQGISFCNIAKKAQELGRKDLAIKVNAVPTIFQCFQIERIEIVVLLSLLLVYLFGLFQLLEMETKCSLQVPLLLRLGESKRALMSATKSGDTDLIYTVLLQLKETTQLADFQMIVRTFPTAQNLYKKYCNLNCKSALQEIFNQEDDFVAQAEYALREGIAVILTIASIFKLSTIILNPHFVIR